MIMKQLFACITGSLLAAAALGGVFYRDGETNLHFAFEGSPNGDRPIIRPPAYYRAEDGFGFVDSPDLRGTSRGVTAPKYFRFDVNIPPGTYDVTVITGGVNGDSITTVQAENHRPMLKDLRAAGRESATGTFTIEVKHGPKGSTTLDQDPCLNLEFLGTNPSLMKLTIQPTGSVPATQPARGN
jgi:hypothetical protein